MSFVVRALSRSAAGREIMRASRFETSDLTIGRDTGSDIRLPDLEVLRHHATLRQLGPDRVEVEAAGNLPVSVNGNQVVRALIDLGDGGEILLGGYRLQVGRGEAAGEVAVTVERIGELASSTEKKDERTLFALASTAPSKRGLAWTFAIGVLALFLAWPIWSFYSAANAKLTPEQMVSRDPHGNDRSWSAGKLSRAHAGLENNCRACHVDAFVAVRDESCATCHKDVHDHATPARLLRAKGEPGIGVKFQRTVAGVFGRPEGRCVDCHTEHEGRINMVAPAQRFCADCHDGMQARLTDTKFADASDFGRNHPQFAPAVLVQPGDHPRFERVSLDRNPKENSGLKFPHALHLSATNGVARMAQTQGDAKAGRGLDCATCHIPDGQGAMKPVSMEANCQSCHSLAFDRVGGVVRTLRHGEPEQVIADLRDFYGANGPARPAELAGMARRRPGAAASAQSGALYGGAVANRSRTAAQAIRAVFSPGGACFDCHQVTQPTAGLNYGIAPVTLPDRYYAHGWFDHRAHTTETCESCHAAPRSKDARDVLMPKIAQCRECHAGEHARRADVPSSCAMCHIYHQGEGGIVAGNRARRGRLVLTGADAGPR